MHGGKCGEEYIKERTTGKEKGLQFRKKEEDYNFTQKEKRGE